MLRELLTTWENWNARDTLTNALHRADNDHSRAVLSRDIDAMPDVDPVDALRDSSDLVRLISGWQWQAVYAARWRGASWEQIADSLDVTDEQARAGYCEVIDRQEQVLSRDVDTYRAAL